ncbi:hypothetical protein AB0A74_23005 [Saccharothrix sp. NPDC042600]|uniref:hypothetical protein n=1 Tax=Saccharothrix TaxID=2071 RepID=UPI0033C070C5|nr:hypothetical protein GCM10017745_16060 [Saccharothrix mutabilis subsp. capreolus]
MNFPRLTRARSITRDRWARAGSSALPTDPHYQPPVLRSPGRLRQVTLGSSSSGNADANSQYYW